MDSEKIKNKLIYFVALGSMCAILVLIMYNFFYRTIEVDVMKNVKLVYTQENGTASVSVENSSGDINKRTEEFLNSVEYSVTPNENLSNGDTIHVTATYDESLASQYHYKAINTEADFIVEGLNNRLESKEYISKEYLDDINQSALDYIEEHADEIYLLDHQEDASAHFVSSTPLYVAFLKSNSTTSDRVVSLCKLDYELRDETVSIYYLVCVPDINDSEKVQTQNIYGEKAYLSQEEKDNSSFESYVQRIFSNKYSIQKIELSQENSEQ